MNTVYTLVAYRSEHWDRSGDVALSDYNIFIEFDGDAIALKIAELMVDSYANSHCKSEWDLTLLLNGMDKDAIELYSRDYSDWDTYEWALSELETIWQGANVQYDVLIQEYGKHMEEQAKIEKRRLAEKREADEREQLRNLLDKYGN